MRNAINWFEIPASDFERAVKFYSDILGTPLRKEDFGGLPHGYFPSEDPGVGGAVVFGEGYVPSMTGATVHLNPNGKIEEILSQVEAAGGQIILPKQDIGGGVELALIIDTEGNKIGLIQRA
jgi:predicted enzyme related to lactoylglutathione lyase